MKLRSLVFCLCLTAQIQAGSAQEYLTRFIAYQQWSQNLPTEPQADFLAFIDEDSPLAQKLREKWLYQLARQKDWAQFIKHYKESKDLNLQCLYHSANYSVGKVAEALAKARVLWLSGDPLPDACNALFDVLLKSPQFDEHLLTQRLILALDKGNLPLSRFLLRQYKLPRLKEEQLLLSIYHNPSRINQLKPGELQGYFYLFGLKRLIARNMAQAIKYWQDSQTKGLLNEAEQQAFLVHLALYKAIRNQEDLPRWFAQIKPRFYTDILLDWQIRFALKGENWSLVESLINQSPDKDKPCWQYWLARALEAQGKKSQALPIYNRIAQSRNYYGFLASMRLHKKPSFENEKPVMDLTLLKPYQPVLDKIKALYLAKQAWVASRLLNDFVSELPKEDKSALAYWVATELKWHSKSVYLSNSEELNNQLVLRFPVIYQEIIANCAKNYNLPQALIYAIIRQESGFCEDVVSSAGARGLMQLMPKTASLVAKRERIAYQDKKQLFTSQKNITIGIAYLNQLTKRYSQHPVLAAAAYNAGPSQVNYWLKNHPPKAIDIWIDTLPWRETRDYLKNILAFNAVYQFRLGLPFNLDAFMFPFI